MSDAACFLSAVELASMMRNGVLSPVEVVDAHLRRIETRNARTNAYVTVLAESACAEARAAEKALRSGEQVGPLTGIPIAIKDLYETQAGVRATYGALPLAHNVADSDAICVRRLKAAGAVILGRTNSPEFGHKGTTDNMLFGATSTPFAPGRNSGGSSGGSAAAVGEGTAVLATGSDAGGSIRIPAAWCGVYGLYPSFGRLAVDVRPDAFCVGAPFTNVGPLARTVADAALMLSVMKGPHAQDPLCLPDDGLDYVAATRRAIAGLRVAYSPDLDVYPVEREVADVCAQAVLALEEAGASVDVVRLGIARSQDELCRVWRRQHAVLDLTSVLAFKRAGIDLLGRHRDELPSDFVTSVEQAMRLTAVDLTHDDWIRTEVFDAVQGVLATHDVIACPTLACMPVENGPTGSTVGPSQIAGERVDPLIGWCLTYLFNLSGHPAASVPAGFSADGLPIGLQIVGRRFDEATVLAVSAAFERVRPWRDRYRGL